MQCDRLLTSLLAKVNMSVAAAAGLTSEAESGRWSSLLAPPACALLWRLPVGSQTELTPHIHHRQGDPVHLSRTCLHACVCTCENTVCKWLLRTWPVSNFAAYAAIYCQFISSRFMALPSQKKNRFKYRFQFRHLSVTEAQGGLTLQHLGTRKKNNTDINKFRWKKKLILFWMQYIFMFT